jgi:bacterioferritin
MKQTRKVKELDAENKVRLIGFVCAFAWADLELHPKERDAILRLVERLKLDEAGRSRVLAWLKAPPPVDVLDPYEIPKGMREAFLEECEEMIRVDGVVHPEERETLALLTRVLFGDGAAGKRGAGAGGRAAVASAEGKETGAGGGAEEGHMAAKKAKSGGDRGGGAGGKQALIDHMNAILQMELAGVHRYLHYSFMVFGHNRIPIVSFFRTQAQEGMQHAIAIGEKITAYGGHPTIRSENPPEGGKHDVHSLLTESLEFERRGLALYRELLDMCGGDVALEELTRAQIRAETEHCEEVEKMLRGARGT